MFISLYTSNQNANVFAASISDNIYCNLPTLDPLRIIELFLCHDICLLYLMKHEERFLKSCTYDMYNINLTEDASWKMI